MNRYLDTHEKCKVCDSFKCKNLIRNNKYGWMVASIGYHKETPLVTLLLTKLYLWLRPICKITLKLCEYKELLVNVVISIFYECDALRNEEVKNEVNMSGMESK